MSLEPFFAATPAIRLHLVLALLAVALGTYMLVARKGTPAHRWTGRAWVATMLVVAVGSFWITGNGGTAGYSWIHGLSAIVIAFLGVALWAIRTGRVRTHRGFMIGLYFGLIGAGAGALLPGRLISRILGYA
jgi:uncharacterized membrane protein